MKYPVICFNSDLDEKIFLIPKKQPILDLSRNNNFELGSNIFLSLLDFNEKIEQDNYNIYIINSNDLNKELLDFEKKTLFSTNDYQCIFIFDHKPLEKMEERDIDTISDFVNINLSDKKTNKYIQ